MKSRILVACVAAPLVAGFGSAASAASFTYDDYDIVHGQTIHVRDYSPWINEYGTAGQITLHGNGAFDGQELKVFCLDIYDALDRPGGGFANDGTLASDGTGGSNPVTLTSVQQNTIGFLMSIGQTNIDNNTLPSGYTTASGFSHSANAFDVSAATQLAIWKVEYEGEGVSFTSLPHGVGDLADYMISLYSGGIYAVQTFYDTGRRSNQTQGLFISTHVTSVPLPASLPLFVGGLAGLGLLGKRRMKKKVAA
jgi:hypothetical protein